MVTRPRKSPLLQMDTKTEDLMLGYDHFFLCFPSLHARVSQKYCSLTISSNCDLLTNISFLTAAQAWSVHITVCIYSVTL